MSIDIEELKIVLYTNIQDNELKNIVFNSGMLYHPELSDASLELNEYPYFTSDIKYPFSKLHYLTYKDRVEFFFNKDKFRETLSIYTNNENILDTLDIVEFDEIKEKKYYEERNKNIETNIMIMLDLLFPTKYPVINDLQTSIDVVFNNSKIKYMVLNPIIKKYFSYLNLNNEIYTFKKVIWINDILNHPKYRKLILEYRKLLIWSKQEKYKQINIIRKDYDEFIEKNINNLYNKIFKLTNSQIRNVIGENPLLEKIPLFLELKLLTGKNIDEMKKNITDFYKIQNGYKKFNWENKIDQTEMKYNIIEKFIRINDILEILNNYFINFKETSGEKSFIKLFKDEKIFNNKINERFSNAIKMYEKLNNMFIKKNDSEFNSFQEYYNYNQILLREFKKPVRESTNINLQTLIEKEDEKSIKEYYEFIKFLYTKFFYSKKTKNNYKTLEHYKKYMNIDVCNINIGGDGPKREIYVYVDFIKGELNDNIVKQIYCPYLGEYLGKEFDYLSKLALNGKMNLNDWDINKHRVIVSLDDLIKIEKKKETERENTNVGTNISVEEQKSNFGQVPFISSINNFSKMFQTTSPPIVKPQKIPSSIPETLNNDFQINILFKEKNKDEIKELISNVNKYTLSQKQRPINNIELLKFINENEPRLYILIEEWENNRNIKNSNLIKKIIELKNNLKSEIELNQIELDRINNTTRNVSEIENLNYNINLKELYVNILNILQKSEDTKRIAISSLTTGGISKKKRRKKRLFTKKNIYKR